MSRRVFAAVIGFFLTGLALALLLVPEVIRAIAPLDNVVSTLTEQDPRVLMLVVSVAVGLLGLAVSRGRPQQTHLGSEPIRLVSETPETAQTERRTRPGAALDEQLTIAVEGDETAAVALRESLRERAVRTLASDPATSVEAARAAVDDGSWTDDSLVAVYLGRETLPLSARLRAWLDPGAEQRRRARRTVAAIERAGPDE